MLVAALARLDREVDGRWVRLVVGGSHHDVLTQKHDEVQALSNQLKKLLLGLVKVYAATGFKDVHLA